MQNTQFTTQKNQLNICCIVLSNYDREIITKLKKHDFKYFSKTKEWSKIGFTDLQLFEFYCLAVINNDTKTIKKLEPKKDDLKADLRKLSTIKYQSKKEYIKARNDEKMNEIEKIFDRGVAEIMCQYCIKNKLNFWSMNEIELKAIIINNLDIQKDIIEFNTNNNINTCNYIERIYNEGLPF